jgi:hypothetical protein
LARTLRHTEMKRVWFRPVSSRFGPGQVARRRASTTPPTNPKAVHGSGIPFATGKARMSRCHNKIHVHLAIVRSFSCSTTPCPNPRISPLAPRILPEARQAGHSFSMTFCLAVPDDNRRSISHVRRLEPASPSTEGIMTRLLFLPALLSNSRGCRQKSCCAVLFAVEVIPVTSWGAVSRVGVVGYEEQVPDGGRHFEPQIILLDPFWSC